MGAPAADRAARASGELNARSAAAQWSLASLNVTLNADGGLTLVANASLQTTMLSILVPSVAFSRSTSVSGSNAPGASANVENACIFTMGEDLEVASNTMTFNGSPNVMLSGCSLRSNKSMKCNGGSTDAQTFAVGSIVGCSNPHGGQPAVPDVYASLAGNISFLCGANANGYLWTAGNALPAPVPNALISVPRSGYTELHVCGTLTLAGDANHSLTGAAPASDTVVIIENGKIVLSDSAYVSAVKTTFVLAGGGASTLVEFPNGAGKSATLDVSASTAASNPWKGVAIYQNPSVQTGVDTTWKPGATLSLSGVVYFPNAWLTVQGNIVAGAAACAKIVAGEFTLNGAVNLQQSSQACADAAVTQYVFPDASAGAANIRITQ